MMNTVNKASLIALILSVCLCNVAYAFPKGTGSCIGGQAAVGGEHLTPPTIQNGTLGEFDMIFGVNGAELTEGTAGTFVEGESFTVAVNASQENLRGCFIRFETEDTTSSSVFELTPGDNTQIASVCDSADGATGLTHTSNSRKLTCNGEVIISYIGRVYVDVTTVISLEEDSSSTYAYTQYILESASLETGSPTPFPVEAPVDVPVEAPVEKPVAKPIDAPVDTPVAAPVEAPVEAPVAAPSSHAGIQICQKYNNILVAVLGVASVYSFF